MKIKKGNLLIGFIQVISIIIIIISLYYIYLWYIDNKKTENILNEIKDEYQIVGTPRGIIVGRGYEGENFQRIMEIQIPIALKH